MSSASPRIAELGPALVFAALGDRTRLALVRRLSDGRARSLSVLSRDTDLTRQAVAKHLRVLEQAGLVQSARVGRESRFACRPEPLAEARAWLDAVSAQWDDALGRLRDLVEG
jgi:DNA-binding transcriptional ArsR family regulator